MRLIAAVVVPAVLFVPLVLLGLAVTARDLWRRWRRSRRGIPAPK